MPILMPNPIYHQIVSHCLLRLPSEACGVLLGTQEAGMIVIDRFIPLSNKALHPESGFEIDQREWIRLLFGDYNPNQHVIGIIHSHPTSLAIPSTSDLQTLWHSIPTHWIISCINKNKPILKAFSFHADGAYETLHWHIQH